MRKFISPLFSLESSLSRFIIGTAALTISLQFIYDAVNGEAQWQGFWLALALMFIAMLVVWTDRRREIQAAQLASPQDDARLVEPRRGLILLVGIGNMEAPLTAIAHHAETLEHCWLLASSQSLATADDIDKEAHQSWPKLNVHPVMDYLVRKGDAETTWRVVERIYVEAEAMGLAATDIVADITGGTKPMTAGMALACIDPERDMQYIDSPRNAEGNVIQGSTKRPILLSTHTQDGSE